MIKFFRRIRKELLAESKFSKYLIYAIGEIVLVVIGILIALALNNWNEENENEQQILKLLDDIEKDLISNYHHASEVLAFYRNQDSICKLVIHDELTIQDYRNNDVISIVAVDWDQLVPISENFEKFLTQEHFVPKRLKAIVAGLNELQYRKAQVDDNWSSLKDKFQENMKLMTNKVLFSSMDSLSRSRRYQYMLTDPEYKSIVDLYWIHAQVYYDQTSKYRAQTMAALGAIRMLREDFGIRELDELYQNLGMRAFRQVDCNYKERAETGHDEIRRSYLVGNMTDEEMVIEISNEGDDFLLPLTLGPRELRSTPSQYIGLEANYKLSVELKDDKGNCTRKYLSDRRGYLLIEK